MPLLLFIITILSRIPFTSKLLYHVDSVHFALAIEKYDITTHQPHPPGYFLYVMLGRFLNLFIGDANTVFVTISIIFSGLTVVAIYYLGKDMFDRKTGIIAALFAITSPNMWFHGEVALTYIVEAFFSTLIGFLCWKIYKGEHKYLWLSVIVLGVAGGIRQNTLVFLFPLWLFSIKDMPLQKIIASFALLGIVCLAWFIPMIKMTGGYEIYREAFRELWLFNTGGISVFEKGIPSLKTFSSALFNFTIYGTGAGTFVLGIAAYSIIRNKRTHLINNTKALFFTLWILPSILFYLLIFIDPANPGYVLFFMPAIFILLAVSTLYIGDELKKLFEKNSSIFIISILIVMNLLIFLTLKNPVAYSEISDYDQNLSLILNEIKLFDPSTTAVFVEPCISYGYRHIMYYLPEYRVFKVDVRVAPTGEIRKTFWGINRKTFLTDVIITPSDISSFISLLISKDNAMDINGVAVQKLKSPNISIASGDISLINKIYPELRIKLR